MLQSIIAQNIGKTMTSVAMFGGDMRDPRIDGPILENLAHQKLRYPSQMRCRKESSARIISAKILIQDESCMERKGHVSRVESNTIMISGIFRLFPSFEVQPHLYNSISKTRHNRGVAFTVAKQNYKDINEAPEK